VGLVLLADEGEEIPDCEAAEETVTVAHAELVCVAEPVGDTDAEPVLEVEAVADKLYVTVPEIDRENVGDVEPECVTEAEGLSVPEPQDDALLEGEGVPVEEWLTEPERESNAAEGVDTGEKVAEGVDATVKVPLALGEGDTDTLVVWLEKMEGVEREEAVAEEEGMGVLERVPVGERDVEEESVEDWVAAAEPEETAVPDCTQDAESTALAEGNIDVVGELVPGLDGVFCAYVGDTDWLTVAVKEAVTVTDAVPVMDVE
jgi:hypothetical protein